jgi:hypothetical protein
VATAYYQRLTGVQRQSDRIADIATNGLDRLGDAMAWVWLAAVPDIQGQFEISNKSWWSFEAAVKSDWPTIIPESYNIQRTQLMQGRLHADGSVNPADPDDWGVSVDRYTDGSSFFAVGCSVEEADSTSNTRRASDEALSIGILSGLMRAHEHARATGAGGNLLVHAGLHGATPQSKIAVGHYRNGNWTAHQGTSPISADPPGIEVVSPSDADSPRQLIQTARTLCLQLGHSFGLPQLPHFTSAGDIDRWSWVSLRLAHLRVWAAQNGVSIDGD